MRRKKEAGFTLIELLIAITIIGVLTGLVALNMAEEIKKSRLKEATTQFYSDLKKCRVDAMTNTANASTRGFGFNFNNATTYRIFEFNDVIEVPVNALDAYHYGNISSTDTVTETLNPVTITVPNGVQVKVKSSGTTPAEPFFFDRRGWLRNSNWSTGGETFILELEGAIPRCVVLSISQIRQGVWNDPNCNSN